MSASASITSSSSASSASSSASSSADSVVVDGYDDFHVHLRDEPHLTHLSAAIVRTCRRALIMPNLKPPVLSVDDASAYRNRLMSAIERAYAPKPIPAFTPLFTLYLTNSTTISTVDAAASSGFIFAFKLYPAGATTHSQAGVDLQRLEELTPVFRRMEEKGLLLLLHGEVNDPNTDIFDRERLFYENYFPLIRSSAPKLKIVLEHISTKFAADFLLSSSSSDPNVAATITAHHLLYTRSSLLSGGLNAHFYCLPILKTQQDRDALLALATSGFPRVFAGTDSAPHPKAAKQGLCPCPAGCYTALTALEMYAEAFDSVEKLDKLNAFLSENGVNFYGLNRSQHKTESISAQITLKKEESIVPKLAYLTKEASEKKESNPAAEDVVVPLRNGEKLKWKVHVPSEREPTIALYPPF